MVKKRFRSIRLGAWGTFVLCVSILLFYTAPADRSDAGTSPQTVSVATVADTRSLLPFVMNDYPAENAFGLQLTSISDSGGLTVIAETDTRWAQSPGIFWPAVEPTPGAREWSAVADREQQLVNAAEHDITPVVVIMNTPEWAQLYDGRTCGPIDPNFLDDFADFTYDVVKRYSKSPYNVTYWQIWNEPDIGISSVPPDSPFGCWGIPGDPYYGGRYYGEMLKAVYPRIKAADSNAKLLVGGLLLDCDPNDPPPNKDCTPAKFLEGILVAGAGSSFDGVSFHAYDYYGHPTSGVGNYGHPNWNALWSTTGPVAAAKAAYIRDLLARYGATGKFLMNTEAGVVCDGTCGATFETTKAYYVAESYAVAVANDIRANLWYSLFGWRNSGLLDENRQPLPAFEVYAFASEQLLGASFVRNLTEYPGVRGYVFRRNKRPMWMLWAVDGNTHAVTLPNHPSAVYGVDGTLHASSNPVTVTRAPLYLEFTQ